MDFGDKILQYLKKIQDFPESTKKYILWSIVVFLALIMAGLWIRNVVNVLPDLSKTAQQIELPEELMPSSQPLKIDATAWKTYTNKDFGFEIKYPADLKYRERKMSSAEINNQIVKDDPGHKVFELVFAKDPKADVVNSGILLEIFKEENEEYKFMGSATRFAVAKDGYQYIVSSFGTDAYFSDIVRTVVENAQFIEN